MLQYLSPTSELLILEHIFSLSKLFLILKVKTTVVYGIILNFTSVVDQTVGMSLKLFQPLIKQIENIQYT
jgi:hypothetical protein